MCAPLPQPCPDTDSTPDTLHEDTMCSGHWPVLSWSRLLTAGPKSLGPGLQCWESSRLWVREMRLLGRSLSLGAESMSVGKMLCPGFCLAL